MAGIINPFWAKLADMSSRGWCLLAATMLYTIGYACTAGSLSIHALAAGQVIYTIGELNSCIDTFRHHPWSHSAYLVVRQFGTLLRTNAHPR